MHDYSKLLYFFRLTGIQAAQNKNNPRRARRGHTEVPDD
jgi:hypothetical protein